MPRKEDANDKWRLQEGESQILSETEVERSFRKYGEKTCASDRNLSEIWLCHNGTPVYGLSAVRPGTECRPELSAPVL